MNGLPPEYVELSYEEKLKHLQSTRSHTADLRAQLDTLRDMEDGTAIDSATTNVPMLGPIRARQAAIFKDHEAKVYDVCVIPQSGGGSQDDTRGVLSLGQDGIVMASDLHSGDRYDAFKVGMGNTLALAAPPTGRVCAVGGLGCAASIYGVGSKLNRELQNHVEDYPFIRRPPRSASHPNLEPVQTADERLLTSLPGPPAALTALKFTSETKLAAGTAQGTVHVFEVSTGDHTPIGYAHSDTITCIASSKTGTSLATGGDDAEVQVWDLRANARTHTFLMAEAGPSGAQNGCVGCHFLPDGQSLLAADRNGVAIYDMRTNKLLSQVFQSQHQLSTLAVSSTGRLALVGLVSGLCGVVDILKRVSLGQLQGHRNLVSAIAVEGSMIVTASFDKTLRFWEVE